MPNCDSKPTIIIFYNRYSNEIFSSGSEYGNRSNSYITYFGLDLCLVENEKHGKRHT